METNTDFTHAIDLRRDERQRSLLDTEITSVAIKTLANEFLNVPGLDLDLRAWIVDTTLPTVLIALEKLLRQVEKKHLVGTRAGKEGDETAPHARSSNEHAIPSAAEGLPQEPDKPIERFDSINWLAQYLYRNNPRFSNFADTTSSPYLQELNGVAKQLKARLFELDSTRRAKARADQLRMRQEEDRATRMRSAQIAERQRLFRELLTSLYTKWNAKLWRPVPCIYHFELLEAYKNVFSTQPLQLNPELLIKLNAMITALTPETKDAGQTDSVSCSTASLYDDARTSTAAPSSAESVPTESDQPTDGDYRNEQSPPAPEMDYGWSLEDYLETGMTLMTSWTIEDLTTFLRELSSYIDGVGNALKQNFSEAFYLPRFHDLPPTASREDWMRRFASLAETFATDRTDIEVDPLKEACKRFYGHVLQTPESGSDTITSTAVTEGNEQGGQGPGEIALSPNLGVAPSNTVPTRHAIFEAENEYRNFAKQLAGEVGIKPFRVFMEFMRTQLGNEEAKAAADNEAKAAAEKAQSAPLSGNILQPLEMDKRHAQLQILFDLLGGGESVASLAQLSTLFDSIARTSGISTEVHAVSTDLTNTLASSGTDSSDTIGRLDFCAHVKERCTHLNDLQFEEMVNALTIAGKAVKEKPVPAPMLVYDADSELENTAGNKALVERISITGLERTALEKSAIEAIAVLSDTLDISIVDACAAGFEMIADTLRKFHVQENTVRELLQQSVSKVAAHPALNGLDLLSTAPGVTGILSSTVNETPMPATDQPAVDDVKFVEAAETQLVSTLERINARERTIILAHAGQEWAKEQGNVEVDVFLPSSVLFVREGSADMFKLEELVPATADDSVSTHMQGIMSRLVKLSHEDHDAAFVAATLSTKTVIPAQESTFLPITDSDGHCIGVMRVKPKPPAQHIPEEDMEEVWKTIKVLGKAIDLVKRGPITQEAGVTGRLDAENMDEASRQHLLFPKLMLLNARDALSKLSSNALSELRSYRKPPATIHKVVKAVLFLFGKTPKEVTTWTDCCRFLNTDLLKMMIDYDPTAVQKKIRFQRVKKVLRTIPHGDVKKRGSIPAQYMSDWLIASVDLRDQAVKRRKARPASDAPEEQSEIAADEEDEDEIEGSPSAPGSRAGSAGGISVRGSRGSLLLQDEYELPGIAEGSLVVAPIEDNGTANEITVSGGGIGPHAEEISTAHGALNEKSEKERADVKSMAEGDRNRDQENTEGLERTEVETETLAREQ